MGRANPTVLFGFFVAVIVALCGAALLKGGLYIGRHEGDTLHVMQIVFRMAQGQVPHLDFVTPIGIMAFAPIVLFVKLGYGIGMSFLLAQTLMAIVFLPVVWWVAYSRMRGFLPYLFGLIIFVLIAALVHGEAQRAVSVSMHYNRWSWAAAFVAIATALLPTLGRARPRVDGIIIGLAMTFLLLTKVTFFAAFSVPILVALLLRRSYWTTLYSLGSALFFVGLVTIFAGIEFWQAYLSNLLEVALSDVRPKPGEPLGTVIGAPAYIGGSMMLITGVILLRQSREAIGGLVLLLLAPAFFYVTYQNFANDPQWLLMLGVLLIAFIPRTDVRNGLGWDMRSAIKTAAAISFALTAPSFFNLAYSPFRHYFVDTTEYTQMLPKADLQGDIQTLDVRTARTNATVPLAAEGTELLAYREMAQREEPTVFNGETLPDCELSLGMSAWFDTIAGDLDGAGLTAGKSIFAADLISSYWLFGDLEPLKGGAPWYYGGLPGIENADYLLVPLCPLTQGWRGKILAKIDQAGLEFTEIRRTQLYVLYQPTGG